jgi:16S rRNA (cytosine967-C5)-methyltransferase
MKPNNNQHAAPARLQALWWLTSVIKDGRSVNELLSIKPSLDSSPNDRAFAKQLLFGSLRYYHQIKAILDQLLEKPLKQKDSDIFAILILGVYQLRFLSVPDHAAISETVELTRKIKKKWASGLVNGILRQYQRRVGEIQRRLEKANTFQFSHPNWMINQLAEDWPNKYQGILQANNQRAPMTVRVNQLLISRTDYLEHLLAKDIAAQIHPLACDGLVLEQACDVAKLPGFFEGWVTVQDAAAQLVVDLLDLDGADRVLDGCAAPGGKTTHILQRQASVNLTSVEMSAKRMARIEQTIERMGFSQKSDFKLLCADLLATDDWWDGRAFDRILIDVPCTASGVIRRNPDIKLHRKKLDLTNTVELQKKILETAWSLLKPGGRLVYATCSVFKQENERQISRFLQSHNAQLAFLPKNIDQKIVKHGELGYQILPGEVQMDGFYLCGLQKPN